MSYKKEFEDCPFFPVEDLLLNDQVNCRLVQEGACSPLTVVLHLCHWVFILTNDYQVAGE